MELLFGDCLELMPEIKDNSVDLLFCDLPYGQTSCKWDSLIDLEEFWKQVNRICKDDAPMLFTCSVKFGNTLINSNPKCFRYDLVWAKSRACSFLLAKKMPMKKHEMIYVFYRKTPKVYTENIALHHKHKFIKETENKRKEGGKGCYRNGSKTETVSKYDPPLPNSLIQEVGKKYEPPPPKDGEIYGELYKQNKILFPAKDGNMTKYDPPLPNSVIKDEDGVYMKKVSNKDAKYGQKCAQQYDPPLPNTLLECKSEGGKHSTQKPVSLMEWILKYYSREGGVVLDPTMGSGSMGVACKNMNRHFIGIEKDEKIFEVAMERLND
tara:strand:+ start:1638 stop:2606 length:969 start_codon:yes stop_codon:yes gene_type:complete